MRPEACQNIKTARIDAPTARRKGAVRPYLVPTKPPAKEPSPAAKKEAAKICDAICVVMSRASAIRSKNDQTEASAATFKSNMAQATKRSGEGLQCLHKPELALRHCVLAKAGNGETKAQSAANARAGQHDGKYREIVYGYG